MLVDIRRSLPPNSTGLSRELLKLAREANYKKSRWCFPASDITLSTRAFRIKYNGSNDPLYTLTTAEEQGSRVAAISTNYFPSVVEQYYQYISSYEERTSPGTLAHRVQRKELLAMRRGTLFSIDRGPVVLHQNGPGMSIKPVLPAYRHLELVRILTNEHSNNVQYYLDHECFMLGGCLMANLRHTHQGRYHISSIKERDVIPAIIDFSPRLFLGSGVRNNVWRVFSNRNYSMAVYNLTGSKKVREMRHITLSGAARFIHFVESHPFLISLS